MNYRPRFHVTPIQGRLNDPNGMFVDGEVLHLYYQHDPHFPHSPKRTGWAHTAVDLRTPSPARHFPDALYPDMPYDKDGCYSGGAVRDGEGVWLFYTGNLKVGGRRIPSQNRVRAIDPGAPHGGLYVRDAANPLIPDAEPGFTGHFRDPHITCVPGTERWRMVLGAQTAAEEGTIVVYYSDDLSSWEFAGPLTFDTSGAQPGWSPDLVPGGYMWECPNLVSLRDEATGERKDVLVFCPQGVGKRTDAGLTHYASSDQCGYLVGRLDGATFHVERGFSELDYGHEFYAPQLVEWEDGAALLVGWVGLPAQDDTPTVVTEGWVHALTLPRRVTLRDGWLRQEPVWEQLPTPAPSEGFGSVAQARGTFDSEALSWELLDAAGAPALTVTLASATEGQGRMTLRRERDGNERVVPVIPGEVTLIADGCVVEIYAGGGRVVATSAVFGDGDARWKGWRKN